MDANPEGLQNGDELARMLTRLDEVFAERIGSQW
jgi:hypothetical protein